VKLTPVSSASGALSKRMGALAAREEAKQPARRVVVFEDGPGDERYQGLGANLAPITFWFCAMEKSHSARVGLPQPNPLSQSV